MGDNSTSKIQSIQSLRAIAFFFIFLSHTIDSRTGAFGVSIFLVISGFLCTRNALIGRSHIPENGGGIARYTLRKISKLYPLHILTLFMACVFVIKQIINDKEIILSQLIKCLANILLIQSWVPRSSVYYSFNAVAWYLSVAVFTYACFPIIYKKIIKRIINFRTIILWMICVVIGLLLFALIAQELYGNYENENIVKWSTYICPFYRLGDFAIGCLLAVLLHQRDVKAWLKEHHGICIFLEIVCFISIIVIIFLRQIYDMENMRNVRWFEYDLMYLPTSILLVGFFSFETSHFSRWLSIKPLILIGDLSPYLFLLHQIIIRYLSVALKQSNGTHYLVIITIISLCISIVLAQIYESFINKVSLRLKKNEKEDIRV